MQAITHTAHLTKKYACFVKTTTVKHRAGYGWKETKSKQAFTFFMDGAYMCCLRFRKEAHLWVSSSDLRMSFFEIFVFNNDELA